MPPALKKLRRHITLDLSVRTVFVAVGGLGYNQYWPGGFMVFYVLEHPRAQPTVILV